MRVDHRAVAATETHELVKRDAEATHCFIVDAALQRFVTKLRR